MGLYKLHPARYNFDSGAIHCVNTQMSRYLVSVATRAVASAADLLLTRLSR